ncbi:MAG: hypothetical protein A3F73_03995 [Gallionellales bacterium RIFCSPLOWO2_12_FULL_59_22]|nr:MAG: hypothetical protein A3H99_01130 [Gallionellales bacterium RIFCSPLOWO2_02_FULL_59_110]OGT03247.1 MAG: hypothetical protein A2Z65_07030 [Gallionellales bacterium RIFCSPLOWO2_02_58_13]OGT13989.1 MAG: hypothetical protein A3F73_03995 [Gallionellales bacterium RIFCSPLOWO2_12_FULL_59_22]
MRFSALHAAFYLLPSAFCCAEELPDPTRPPPGILAPLAEGEAPPAPAGLQSTIISKTRRAAIIDGETVELGGKHGAAKLIEVNEGNVVLRGAQGRQVMSLFPGITMRSGTEVKEKQRPAASEVQTGKQVNKPVAREEKK